MGNVSMGMAMSKTPEFQTNGEMAKLHALLVKFRGMANAFSGPNANVENVIQIRTS